MKTRFGWRGGSAARTEGGSARNRLRRYSSDRRFMGRTPEGIAEAASMAGSSRARRHFERAKAFLRWIPLSVKHLKRITKTRKEENTKEMKGAKQPKTAVLVRRVFFVLSSFRDFVILFNRT